MVTLLDFRKRRSPRVFKTNCPAGAVARPGAAVRSPGVDAARTAWHDRDSLASAAGLLECCSGHRGPTRLFPMTPECRGEGMIQAAATWRITASATVSCGDLACEGAGAPRGPCPAGSVDVRLWAQQAERPPSSVRSRRESASATCITTGCLRAARGLQLEGLQQPHRPSQATAGHDPQGRRPDMLHEGCRDRGVRTSLALWRVYGMESPAA